MNDRPMPTRARSGRPAYYGPWLAAYRMSQGISAEAVAQHLDIVRTAVTAMENSDAVTEKLGERFLKAVAYLVGKRERMIREGRSRLDVVGVAETEYAALNEMPGVVDDEKGEA